jgi:hypothetical protein
MAKLPSVKWRCPGLIPGFFFFFFSPFSGKLPRVNTWVFRLSIVHCRRRCCLKSIATAVRSGNLQAPTDSENGSWIVQAVREKMSVSPQQMPSSMLPQIHRHCSLFRKSPSSRRCQFGV